MHDRSLSPTLTVDSDFTLYELAAWDCNGLAQLFGSLGIRSLPALSHWITDGERTAIRLTSRLGLLLSGPGTVLPDLQDSGGCVVDLTHGRSRLTLEGPRSEQLISALIAIDVDPEHFPAGSSCVAPVHGVPVTLLRRSQNRFELLLPLSFAESLQGWIRDAGIALSA
jgi:sarcosine oxidase subunit gamma